MAIPLEVQTATDIAKQYLNDSDLDDGYRSLLVDLLETSTIATNGVSQEQKIQMMTQCIHKLAISQVGLVKSIGKQIEDAINKTNAGIDERIAKVVREANNKQCSSCKAMKHAEDVEKEEMRRKIIEDFLKNSGLKLPKGTKVQDLVIDGNTVKLVEDEDKKKGGFKLTKANLIEKGIEILKMPWIWIFGSVVFFSPYSIEIIKMIFQYFGKGGS